MSAQHIAYIVWALGGLGLLNVVVRAIRNRGLAGGMLGTPIQDTVGELDLGKRGGIHKRIKVHRLSTTDPTAPEIGLQVVTTTFASAGMSVIPLTRSQALRMRALLSQALGPARAGEEAV